MGANGYWWFFKIKESDWTRIKPEFEQAAGEILPLPEVQPYPLRSLTLPISRKYGEALLAGVLAGNELGKRLFHRPFQEIAFKLFKESSQWANEYLVGLEITSRVLPTVVLMTGIGRERFAQLPGYLGNMLLHPDEVAGALELVTSLLDVDWENYSALAKSTLDYGGPSGSDFDRYADEDVANVLHALPNALQRVKQDGDGLLVLSSWEAPLTETTSDSDSLDDEEAF